MEAANTKADNIIKTIKIVFKVDGDDVLMFFADAASEVILSSGLMSLKSSSFFKFWTIASVPTAGFSSGADCSSSVVVVVDFSSVASSPDGAD